MNKLLFAITFLMISCFADEVVLSGILEPSEKETVVAKSSSVMVENVNEGEIVKKGDILFKLDTIEYEEQKISIESDLRKLEADQKVNLLNYENRLLSAKQKVGSTQINYDIATLNYEELKMGADPVDIKVSEERVRLAELVYENSKMEIGLVKKLVDNGYLSKEELTSLEFRAQSEAENLKLLKEEHQLVMQGPTTIQIEEAKILMNIRKKELENTQSQLEILTKGYEELVAYQKREYNKRHRRLEKVLTNLENCVAIAPIDGTVFYERYPWGEKIPTGKYIWEGLKVRSIANLSNMSVKVKIPVEIISNFHVKQKAKILIFSTNSLVDGEIERISQIQEDEFIDAHEKTKEVLGLSNKKIFVVWVKIGELLPDLKPGMTAKVMIDYKNEKN